MWVRAVRASDDHGLDWAAATFDVGTASLKRWRRLYRETGGVEPRPMGGARRTRATRERLEEAVAEKPDRILRELASWFIERWNVFLSQSGLSRALSREGFGLRKKVVLATERSQPHVVEARRTYLDAVSRVDPERLVFLDESGCQRGMIRERAWRRRGTTVIGRRVRNRGTVTTVLSALSLDGVIATMFGEGATTKEVFLAFVEKVLVPTLRPGNVVVMDNLAAHHSEEVDAAIVAAGASTLFLPPYAPELNPIEEAWSKLKTRVRALAPGTLRELHAAIADAIDSITPRDALGWFIHCGYLNPDQT